MHVEALFGLAAANFLSSIIPGQNTALVTGRASRFGYSAGLGVISGVLVADLAWVFLALLTLDGLVEIPLGGLEFLQFLGGFILIFLGVVLLVGTKSAGANSETKEHEDRTSFWAGVFVGGRQSNDNGIFYIGSTTVIRC